MRVIVFGSRTWRDRGRIADRLFDLPVTTTLVVGMAKGADMLAYQEGQKLGLLLEPHPAEWNLHGELNGLVPCNCPPEKSWCKLAGFRRNEEMAFLGAELGIAFWDGKSRGTLDMMERCARHNIPIEVQHARFPNRPTARSGKDLDATPQLRLIGGAEVDE